MPLNRKNKIIVITGQTATGKTRLALKLAEKYNGELINADSRQIYRQLNLITGKDIGKYSMFNLNRTLTKGVARKIYLKAAGIAEPEFRLGYYWLAGNSSHFSARVWLYDVVSPDQYFSSYDYSRCALQVIRSLLEAGKTPIVVGGTYLYLLHLLYNVSSENIPPDWQLRSKLADNPIEELQQIYAKLDSRQFAKLNHSDRNNPQRLIRKIEISSHLKKSYFKFKNKAVQFNSYNLTKKLGIKQLSIDFIGLRIADKIKLRRKIESRVVFRIKNGAINEVIKLLKLGYSPADPGLKTLGCRQLILFLNKKINLESAEKEWINKEVQYAKRQYVFMKKDPNISWRDV